jgi:hypothetical protein
MALTAQSPEALAAPRTLENDRSTKLVNSVNGTKSLDHQDRLIATVPKRGREEFRISVRDYNGTRKVELRVFKLDRAGGWEPTPRVVVIGLGPIAAVIAALCEAEARL